MALRRIQEYIARDVNNIARVEEISSHESVEFACISCIFPIRHSSSAYIRSDVRGLLNCQWR